LFGKRVPILTLLALSVAFFLSSSTAPVILYVFAPPSPVQVVGTTITLMVSEKVIFVGENFTIHGWIMQQNGVMIGNNNVTVSWANRSVVLETGWDGKFQLANVTFPVGFSPGYTNITAAYSPQISTTLPSHAFLEVQVLYRPSSIKATMVPARGKPLDEMNVSGQLVDASNDRPLQKREVTIKLDSTELGTTMTDASGWFRYKLNIPKQTTNGTHLILISFQASNDMYAPSNTTLVIVVEAAITNQTNEANPPPATPLPSLHIEPAVLSGMKLTVGGTTCGTPPRSGTVIIYFDDVQAAVASVNAGGTFQVTVAIPITAMPGFHLVRSVYNPNHTGAGCQATANVYVLNTPLLGIIATAILMAFSITASRNGRKPEPSEPTRPKLELAPTKPVPPITTTTTSRARRESLLAEALARIELETSYASKIARTYYFTQDLINTELGLKPGINETHREYYARVSKIAPSLREPLGWIVELFELASYTGNEMGPAQWQQAASALTKLYQELERREKQLVS